MELVMRPATRGDLNALATLLQEVDKHYGEGGRKESIEEKIPQIESALFGAGVHALLAWRAEELVGFAAYSFLWPAARATKSLYLKELFISKKHRRQGLGRVLMSAVAQAAFANSCARIEWTTDTDSIGAQEFYRSLGAPRLESKIHYRLEGSELENAVTAWGADILR